VDVNPVLSDIQTQPQSLDRLLDHLGGAGRENLQLCAEQAASNRHIILSGMGASFFAAIPLSTFLAQRGIVAPVVDTSELLHYQRPVCDNATVILVSRSGETVEATRLLEEIKSRSRVIAVTAEPSSTLGRRADCTLAVSTAPDRLVAIQSFSGTVLALLALGACLANQFDRAWRAEAKRAVEVQAKAIPDLLEISEQWKEFLTAGQVLYVTGRGPSLATALEGALLFHEMARVPAVGTSAAQFRHGPVEVVDPDFRCLVLANQETSRPLDSGLARDLTRFGGQVRVLGPGFIRNELPDTQVWELPPLDGTFVPLVEIAALQIAAYRTAIWRGLDPGAFRYAAPVTLNEVEFG
jgi:glutamine---fructose-6-phosphate transaminase (isomerizing)